MFILIPIIFAFICASVYWGLSSNTRAGIRFLKAGMGFAGYWLMLFLLDTAVVKLVPRLFVEFGDAQVILGYELCAMLITLLLGWVVITARKRPMPSVRPSEAEARSESKLSFECPNCHQKLTFLHLLPGENVTCPLCGGPAKAPERTTTLDHVASPPSR
jgi:hypothetical protein